MSNPVEKIQALKNTDKNDFVFPTTLGSEEEKHFTYILIKDIEKGGKQTLVGTIALPMPLDIVDDYKVEYSDANLGPLGATAVGVGASIANEVSLDNIKKSLMSGLGSFNSGLLGQVVAKKAIEFIPGISTGDGRAAAGQIVTSATNKAVNPYITGVFKSIGFKTFNFTFRCHPRNANDSQSLTNIIKFFRDSMLPDDDVIRQYDEDGEFLFEQKTGLQTLPRRFYLDFFTSGSDSGVEDAQLYGSRYLPSINDAAMTSFSVDYETEGAPAFHKDASPVSTIINMTFTESKIYTRDNVRRESERYNILEEGL
tara:strand:+ start:1376 stop:2311 length:936 start_codon:yes stop_codon:yes gene_type:complete